MYEQSAHRPGRISLEPRADCGHCNMLIAFVLFTKIKAGGGGQANFVCLINYCDKIMFYMIMLLISSLTKEL